MCPNTARRKWTQAVIILMQALMVFTVSTALFSHIVLAGTGVSITRTFQPSNSDAWLKSASPDTNFGTDATMETNGATSAIRHSIVRFDISSIPAGSSVSSSSLSLYVTTTNFPNASLYRTEGARRVLVDWSESSVTWNNPGSTAGTHYASTPTATVDIYGGAGGRLRFYDWAVTTDVANFISGTQTNYGWRVVDEGGTASNRSATYATRENTTAANRPKLSLNFTAPWDSYRDPARTVAWGTAGNPFNGTYPVVYMKGTGFKAGTYNVAYYDAGGQQLLIDAGISVSGDGILNSQINPASYPSSTAGTWHALVQPASGYLSFPPNYNSAISAPDTYGLIANTSLEVIQSAIPEFPTVLAGIAVAGTSFGIYYWMRKRAKSKMQRAKIYQG